MIGLIYSMMLCENGSLPMSLTALGERNAADATFGGRNGASARSRATRLLDQSGFTGGAKETRLSDSVKREGKPGATIQ